MHQKSQLGALFLSGLSRPISFLSNLIMILNRLCLCLRQLLYIRTGLQAISVAAQSRKESKTVFCSTHLFSSDQRCYNVTLRTKKRFYVSDHEKLQMHCLKQPNKQTELCESIQRCSATEDASTYKHNTNNPFINSAPAKATIASRCHPQWKL